MPSQVRNLLLIFIALATLWLGAQALVPVYHAVKFRWSLSIARAALERGRPEEAAMAGLNAILLRPNSVEASRLMATISDRIDAHAALAWHLRVVKLLGATEADLHQAVDAALLAKSPILASIALASAQPAWQQSARFTHNAGRIAAARGDWLAAQAHFAEARRRDPQERIYALNEALAALRSRETSAPDDLAKLEAATNDPALATTATRALLRYYLDHGDVAAAQPMAQALAAREHLEALDFLLLIETAQALGNSPQAAAHAKALLDQLYDETGLIGPTGLALLELGQAGELHLFLGALPARWQQQIGTRLLQAQTNVALGDWEGVNKATEALVLGTPPERPWGLYEPIRRALRLRATREMGGRVTDRQWKAIVKSTHDAASLILLARLAAQWQWRHEHEQTLRALAKLPGPHQRPALETLFAQAMARQDTYALMETALQSHRLAPQDNVARNNVVILGLLTKSSLPGLDELSQEVLAADPSNPHYVSTRAFTLLVKGRPGEALALLKTLPEDARREPGVALYTGLVLSALGDGKARDYLELAASAPLLAEEEALRKMALAQMETP